MDLREADKIRRAFYQIDRPSEDDIFMFTEAMNFLIDSTHNSEYMLELGGMYYGARHFDQALKYYDMSCSYGNSEAAICLGYIWYYGRTGEKDYQKAFKYFSRGMELGDPVATYKVADMYKNGYYVEKDADRYKTIMEDLYLKYKDSRRGPLADIFTRIARIRVEEGRITDALLLYDRSRKILAHKLIRNSFFGDLNVMKWTTEAIYELRDFDKNDIDLYDLYYLLKEPVTVRFRFEDRPYEVKAVAEDGETVICFGDKWYRTTDDFFKKASIGDYLLTTLYDELEDFEVTE